VTWFHPLRRHGLQRPDFQIERGGVSQTGALVLRSDNDPEPDERITVTGQRIGQRVRQRCQEPKNDFLASMCPKWVPHTLSASQIRTYDERVRNPTRALMAAGTPVFSTSRGPSFSDHFYPARRGIDCGPRRSTEVVLEEQPLPVARWSRDARRKDPPRLAADPFLHWTSGCGSASVPEVDRSCRRLFTLGESRWPRAESGRRGWQASAGGAERAPRLADRTGRRRSTCGARAGLPPRR
jgi:hypothetical protein